MADPMKKVYNAQSFAHLLAQFQSVVDSGEYKEKIPYDTWRKLKKLTGPIWVEYTSPFVRIYYIVTTSNGEETPAIIYSAKTYDWGFGRFFYDYVVKEKDRMTLSGEIGMTETLAACDKAMSAASAVDGVAYTKADSWADTLTGKIAYDCDGNCIAEKANSATSAYSTHSYDTVTIAGDPIKSNTIELNIPSLDYLGYHQVDGTWNSVASRSDMEDRFNKLEAELQKKVDKAENKCVKENDIMMKGFNFDFGPCTNNNVRMSMYGMAVKNASGNWVSYDTKNKSIMNVDIFNFDGAKFMYKIPVAIKDVAIGDVVIHAHKPMFVISIDNDNGTISAVDPVDGEMKDIMLTQSPFGFNFATKVVSLFGAFTDAPTADQPFGNMLPFLMLGDDNKDIDPMMMFFMMNQGGNGAMNPMMWYFMFKDNKDIDPAMMWMVMSMASGTAPAFMTGNYNKATVAPATQA